MINGNQHTTPAIYFKSLSIENIRCFKEEQTIHFTGKNGEPAQWTVVLGNNNTGKTTLLRVLADFEPAMTEEKFGERIITTPMIKGKWLSNIIEQPTIFKSQVEYHFIKNKVSSIFKTSFHSDFAPVYDNHENTDLTWEWMFFKDLLHSQGLSKEHNSAFFIVKYGVLRITDNNSSFINHSGFIDENNLISPELWLIQADYAAKSGVKNSKRNLRLVKNVLKSILPDVQDFRFQTNSKFEPYVEVQTDFGWVRINELGYGYQTLMAWVVDLAKKMFGRYSDSEHPLKEPAIVLVDELDLHLHPEWQRKIISWLSHHFPRTQFIVTAHSPLLVQSADRVNVVLLRKEGNQVKIEQPNISTFKGWTVEEILSDLMGLDNRTYSEAYLELMQRFDDALNKDNYTKAKLAFNELDKILHATSPQRKLLKLQMAAIIPEEPVEI